MTLVQTLKRYMRNSDTTIGLLNDIAKRLDGTVAGIDNQSRLLNEKLQELIEGSINQSRLLDSKLQQLVEGSLNQSRLLNQKLQELIEASVNQSRLLDDKLMTIVERQEAMIELQKAELAAVREILDENGGGSDISSIQVASVPPSPISPAAEKSSLDTALSRLPLMIDAKTYNTSHPDYKADLVRNFPGKIFNSDKPCSNIVYADIRKLADGDTVQDNVWSKILADALEEAKTVPHSEQVFERRLYIENYMKDLAQKYGAHYAAGWVNLDDALFLYWLVRKLKPRTIVQTGVCNGLSSAFMMLGLAKNGPEGKLHVIDMPPVFDSKDPGWTARGKVYGVVIPEGKSSGWIVPDIYRDRFEVWNGDAKVLLPKMIDAVESVDLFYHDSNHTYDHMMFEFNEAKRKLRLGGLMIGDDVSWNASLWDFADRYGAPSYNFKGAVGVAFF